MRHPIFFLFRHLVCCLVVSTATRSESHGAEYTANLVAGGKSGSDRSIGEFDGKATMSVDPGAASIALEGDSKQIVQVSGDYTPRYTGPLAIAVTLDETGEYWNYSGNAENPGGYSLYLDLLLGHRRWAAPGPVWVKEASAVDGKFTAVRAGIDRESFQVTESEMDKWLFIREGARMVSFRFTSSSPVQPLVSKFLADPDADITDVLKASTARFLNVTRLTLVPK